MEYLLDTQAITWLSQAQMETLFDKSIKTISEHINNVFKEGELEPDQTVRNFRTTAADGKTYQVNHYNLDVIISIGYRVKSKKRNPVPDLGHPCAAAVPG
jgi:hypothetical protein